MSAPAVLKTVASKAAHAGAVSGVFLAGLVLASALLATPDRAAAQAPAAARAPVAASVKPAEGAGPALWVIRDADSTLYLFGTVHVLRPDTGWGSARVDAAFASASDIWFEISNPDDQAAIIPLIQQYGRADPDSPLSARISSGYLSLLDNAGRTVGIPLEKLDGMRPWYAGFILSLASMNKAGFKADSGVELILQARAAQAGKPIHGFETMEQQVRALAGLPQEVQVAFLESTLKEFDQADVVLDEMVNAWAIGDVEALERVTVQEAKATSPEVYDALFVRRNTDFADQIQGLLAGSGTAFIAVGAAHLAGEDSVQAMLETRGVEVERE